MTRLTGAGIALAVVALASCGGGDDENPETERAAAGERGASVEYQVARVVRSFLLAYTEGSYETACARLAPEHRQMVARRNDRPSCERGLALEAARAVPRELERLGRARITKVDVQRESASAEVAMRAGRRLRRFTAELIRTPAGWHITGDLAVGSLSSGRVPKPPPPPPRNPAEERQVIAVFDRYRELVARGNGEAACALQTPAARQRVVEDAVELLGGEAAALREFGTLDCEQIAVGFQIPDGRVERVVVERDRARLTVEGGARYAFRKLGQTWKLDG